MSMTDTEVDRLRAALRYIVGCAQNGSEAEKAAIVALHPEEAGYDLYTDEDRERWKDFLRPVPSCYGHGYSEAEMLPHLASFHGTASGNEYEHALMHIHGAPMAAHRHYRTESGALALTVRPKAPHDG